MQTDIAQTAAEYHERYKQAFDAMYYVEREEAGYTRRIFRQHWQTNTIEVANFAEFQSDGDRTRWYHFSAEIPWHATPLEVA